MSELPQPLLAEPKSPTSSSVRSAAIGQVCDRCRLKKIKCDGGSPICARCTAAGLPCEFSTKLRRKTKARGFSSTEADIIKQLEQENSELRLLLQAEQHTSQCLREELERERVTSSSARPRKAARTGLHLSPKQAARSPVVSVSDDSDASNLDRNAYIIKHMGRLVSDEIGTGRFAGSTSGVHFVLSVEETCRSIAPNLEPFPETCYRSHLIQPLDHQPLGQPEAGLVTSAQTDLQLTYIEARDILSMSLQDILKQIRFFNMHWSGFCPVILPGQILLQSQKLLQDNSGTDTLQPIDYSTLQTIIFICSINRSTKMDRQDSELDISMLEDHRLRVACQLFGKTVPLADTFSLQVLLVYSLYIQISGKRLEMIPLNGLMIRIAHSLGLHRHARRFKFEAGEVEWRRRLWWAVYTFDKLTSVVHGLPQLITDADIDSDFPVDCEFQDITSSRLTHPLPGEPTPISMFVHYIKLAKILSAVLAQLYTTTNRRGGAEKIRELESALRVWTQIYNDHPHVERLELGKTSRRPQSLATGQDHALIGSWLDLMANVCRILIHRPGLTFDKTTKQFRESLNACVTSATAIILLLDDETRTPHLCLAFPSGPNLVFQSALLHVFYHCYPSPGISDPAMTHARSQEILAKSVQILERISPLYSRYGEENNSLLDLMQTVKTLQKFMEAMLSMPSDLPSMSPPSNGSVSSASHSQIMLGNDHTSTSEANSVWNSALENLNQLQNFDWGGLNSTPTTDWMNQILF